MEKSVAQRIVLICPVMIVTPSCFSQILPYPGQFLKNFFHQ
ncbi:MAG: hypothetical protein OP8BY_0835 [Candidatus Saccharicenans subterraneus]|uniref:Uncharacterized protein n=1 Tax=Candidatus Saccharicenans subterraneus TaxID=2508984 RepID=A0A3E2BQ36_9BACT|nr:MAG: hypothetical protein OP8BY_0835 [Candidatus Saccharicenans subterraneum]